MGVGGMPTAFKAVYGSGKAVIGFLLAEYDAAGNCPKAATMRKEAAGDNPDGHGCGHNLLGAGAMAAALAVNILRSTRKQGTVILFGCPSEEERKGNHGTRRCI